MGDGGGGEAAGVEGAAFEQFQLVVDDADDVPAAELVDLLAGVLGDEVLGELPAAPAGAHAEDALGGAGVEDGVGLLFGGELLQALAQGLAGGLAGVLRDASGILAMTPPPESRPSQRVRMSWADFSAMRLAMYQR